MDISEQDLGQQDFLLALEQKGSMAEEICGDLIIINLPTLPIVPTDVKSVLSRSLNLKSSWKIYKYSFINPKFTAVKYWYQSL